MEIAITYNLTDLRELAHQFPDAVLAETEMVMDIIVRRLEKSVVEKTPRGVGGQAGLAGSIFGEAVVMGQRVTGTVGTPVLYGEVIELGRRPGQTPPPIAPLIPWVRSKLGIDDAKEQRSVAFAIARKIGKSGFPGVHMFQRAWAENEQWVQGQLSTIPHRVVMRLQEA